MKPTHRKGVKPIFISSSIILSIASIYSWWGLRWASRSLPIAVSEIKWKMKYWNSCFRSPLDWKKMELLSFRYFLIVVQWSLLEFGRITIGAEHKRRRALTANDVQRAQLHGSIHVHLMAALFFEEISTNLWKITNLSRFIHQWQCRITSYSLICDRYFPILMKQWISHLCLTVHRLYVTLEHLEVEHGREHLALRVPSSARA